MSLPQRAVLGNSEGIRHEKLEGQGKEEHYHHTGKEK